MAGRTVVDAVDRKTDMLACPGLAQKLRQRPHARRRHAAAVQPFLEAARAVPLESLLQTSPPSWGGRPPRRWLSAALSDLRDQRRVIGDILEADHGAQCAELRLVLAATASQPSAHRKVAAPGEPLKPRLPDRGPSRSVDSTRLTSGRMSCTADWANDASTWLPVLLVSADGALRGRTGAEQTRGDVDHREPDLGRWSVVFTAHHHHACQCLHHLVVGAEAAPRPVGRSRRSRDR